MTGGIRIALLGVQHYHANFWANAIKQSDKAELAGLWDADPTIAAAFATEHGTERWRDLPALLDACDAVAICSTTVEHKALIKQAAEAGKAILCEKPLGISEADGLEIRDVLQRTGAVFMQSFPKRFDPVTQAIKECVDSGDLGQITMVRVRHGHSHGLNEEFKSAWFVDPAKSGGGTLLDEGVHAADFLRLVFGEPESVSAMISSATLTLPVEDTALESFFYPNGLIAEVATSWCFAAADASIEVYGTNGTVLVSGVDIASRPKRERDFMQIFRRDGTGGDWQSLDLVPHFKTGVFHEHVAWAFIDALAQGGAMPTGVDDGLRAFAMIDAAYNAARTGVRQSIKYPEGAQ